MPLVEPVDPERGKLTFSVYDPTYYIEVLHAEDEPVLFTGPQADACFGKIIQPMPSLEAVALASALDVTKSGGDGLGELFAETVVVECS